MTAHCCIRVASSGCCRINKKDGGVVSKMERSQKIAFNFIFYIFKSTEKGKGTEQKIGHYAVNTPFGQYRSL